MYKLVLLFLLLPLAGRTQIVTDDFSDGDFTHNPHWTGDSDLFVVNALSQLQLHDTGPGNACLASAFPVTRLGNQEWRFYIRENFSPSGNNNGRVYLVSDRINLKDSLNGYYLQFGEAGSNDAVELFRQNGTGSVSVCRGVNGEIANSFAVTVKVLRDSSGTWKLLVDPLAGSNYKLEATGTDTSIISCSFMGVWALYTKTDASKFYWDDFYAGPVFVDHTLPKVLSVQTIGDRQLDLQFNLNPDSLTEVTAGNYTCDQGLRNPLSCIPDASLAGLVHLSFSQAITPNQRYRLLTNNIKNRNGDKMNPDTSVFWRYVPRLFDVVINEIMANPNPPVSLPPYEYIELYNRRNMPISLDGWTLTQGKKTHTLQGINIMPDSFLLICPATASAAFDPSLPVYALTGFSALNNTGAELTLCTDSGRVMSSVTYSDSWYGDAFKKKGGWSLEQIDPSNPCGGEGNWTASNNAEGGTPCKTNSARTVNPDQTSPFPVRVGILSPDTICLYFNEPLDSTTLFDKSRYSMDHGLSVSGLKPVRNDYSGILFFLSSPLQQGILYTMQVTGGIKDCAGNSQTEERSLEFAIPDKPMPNDLVINEILADEKPGEEKYIELYNRSNKVLDFKDVDIASLDSVTGLVSDRKLICNSGFLFFPGDYCVLSRNGNTIKKHYRTQHPENFIDMPALPKMNMGGGSLAVLAKDGTVLDQVNYSSSWQFPLLSSTKGVALERVDYDQPSQNAGNWHSAAETAGFGTPGDRNSQWMQTKGTSVLSLDDEIFSPDDDGYMDVLGIHYHLDGPGYIGNLNIFDSRGILVRNLMKNVLLGEEGSLTWDGTCDNRQKAAVGIYLILFDVFNARGRTEQLKKACVLAMKMH
ncbi:MAG: lamin tail domain-containing protein [Bacteroidia bacterium]